jgi:four helix bundle protein
MKERCYSFEKLHVWTDIRKMITAIYTLTGTFPENEKYCLVTQIRRAAISVSSNLAEGTSRTGLRDQAHFYQLAYCSLMEVLSQLMVSHDLAFVSKEQYLDIRQQIEIISNKINALRKTVLNNAK